MFKLLSTEQLKQIIMSIQNMTSSNGNPVANQFIVTTNLGRFFQSYNTVIAFIPNDGGKIRLNENWNCSKTTSKYRSEFLNESTSETRLKLANGDYIIDNNL